MKNELANPLLTSDKEFILGSQKTPYKKCNMMKTTY
uniref:Uncharacterized protein n=1 Tax=Arundo donax TaxID=35708 RepID=A0A0A9GV59_ARUDO